MKNLLALFLVFALLPVWAQADSDAGVPTASSFEKQLEQKRADDGNKKRRSAVAEGSTPFALSTDPQKFSYSIGFDIGHSLAQIREYVDFKALANGILEGFGSQTARLTDKQREEIKSTVARKMQDMQQVQRAAAAQKNKDDGDKFLAQNSTKAGVKTTASGLQYVVITEGTGPHPTATDKVTVNYKGSLLDGTVFDSSYERGQPVSFPLANVIPGWTEGVQLMTPGSKYAFFLPSSLAYGEHGAPPKIGPNSALVFEVELVSIDK